MKPIYVFLTTGFEEIEALSAVDILRRAQLDVKMVSLEDELLVTASHGVKVLADMLFDDVDFADADTLVIPGGTTRYNEHDGLKKVILKHTATGNRVAAICAAPMVLGGLGLVNGKKATCYPGFEHYLTGAIMQTDKAVVVDQNIITGRGPGLTFDFALLLVELIAGKDRRDAVAKGLLLL